MEAADRSASLDLLFRGLFLLGVSRQEAGRMMAGGRRRAA
jgi:hypothetical protein